MRQVIAPHVRRNPAESVNKLHNQQVSTLTAADDLARPIQETGRGFGCSGEDIQFRFAATPVPSSLYCFRTVSDSSFSSATLPPGAKRSRAGGGCGRGHLSRS